MRKLLPDIRWTCQGARAAAHLSVQGSPAEEPGGDAQQGVDLWVLRLPSAGLVGRVWSTSHLTLSQLEWETSSRTGVQPRISSAWTVGQGQMHHGTRSPDFQEWAPAEAQGSNSLLRPKGRKGPAPKASPGACTHAKAHTRARTCVWTCRHAHRQGCAHLICLFLKHW